MTIEEMTSKPFLTANYLWMDFNDNIKTIINNQIVYWPNIINVINHARFFSQWDCFIYSAGNTLSGDIEHFFPPKNKVSSG